MREKPDGLKQTSFGNLAMPSFKDSAIDYIKKIRFVFNRQSLIENDQKWSSPIGTLRLYVYQQFKTMYIR